MNTECRRVYTHTGWRQVDDRWMYLHADGAISSAGAVPDICVRPIGTLSRYRIPVPQNDDDLRRSVRTSLELTGLGSADVGFPLRAATCRSVFGGADFSVHLSGETGAFKSERAALEQQFFGAGMNRKNLPAAWSSTGNALEVTAFHGKDALLVIDDFAPQRTATDVNRYHATAERVFRAAGNNAGRGRLDSSARIREPRPPRALILSTGEEIPRGHSIRARLLVLEMSKGDIRSESLAKFQRLGKAGLFAESMGAFLRWIAQDYESVQNSLAVRTAEFRIKFVTGIAHARTPDIVASLQAGFEAYLDFAEAIGAIGGAEREEYASRCWEALIQAGAAQAKFHLAAEPTARFLELLRACLVSGHAHIARRDGETLQREMAAACGWRTDPSSVMPKGECIGWLHGHDLYLEPTVAYQVAYAAARNVGECLSVDEQTMKKRLKEKKLLVSVDEKRGTLTVRRVIAVRHITCCISTGQRSSRLETETKKPLIWLAKCRVMCRVKWH